MMKRRDFITLLGGAATAWPLAARGQQAGKTPRVGYIRAGTSNNDPYREAFVRGMHDLGHVDGHNIAFEFLHYGDYVESIASHISDLLQERWTSSLSEARLQSAPRRRRHRASLSSLERRPIRWAAA